MIPQPQITIGIPTFNGARRISRAIDSVVNQLSHEQYSCVEILVSDNGSSDEVHEVIKKYQENLLLQFKFFKNETNVGYDRNVDLVFKRSSGKYVWLLADDDELKNGAVDEVLHLIDRNAQLQIIQLNFQTYDNELRTPIHSVEIINDVYCASAEEFLGKAMGRYGQVSSLIIRAHSWRTADLTIAFGTNYIHVYAILKILLTGDSYIVSNPLVNVRTGSENFGATGDLLIEVPLGVGRLLSEMPSIGYSEYISKSLMTENKRYVYGIILYAKSVGIASKTKAILNIARVHNSIEFWMIWVPIICLVPDICIRWSVAAKRMVKRQLGSNGTQQ